MTAEFRRGIRDLAPLEYSLVELVQTGPEAWEARAESSKGKEWVKFSGPTANGDAVKFIASRYPRLDAVRPLAVAAAEHGGPGDGKGE